MGIEQRLSRDGMRSEWSFGKGDTRIVLDFIWLVEANGRIVVQFDRPVENDNVVLAIPTGAKEIVFFKSSRGLRLKDTINEKYLDGIDQAGIKAQSEQKRFQEKLDLRIQSEYQAEIEAQSPRVSKIEQDNPFIDIFESMSGIEIDRRYTGNNSYDRAVKWGRMGNHSVVSVIFKQEQKRQCEKFPVLTTKWSTKQRAIANVIPDAIALVDENPSREDILEAIEVAKEC